MRNRKRREAWARRSILLSKPPEVLLIAFTFIALLITLLGSYFIEYLSTQCGYQQLSPDAKSFASEAIKILGAAVYTGFVALLVTNIWQQKSIGLEMLKELNSREFYEVRNALSTQKKISELKNIDIDDMRYWFPGGRYNDKTKIKFYTTTEFIHAHALPNMIYFVVRLSNYARHGMLNVSVTKNLFNVFFVHYRILLLEFANKFEWYYYEHYIHDYQSETELKNEMWLIRADDIRFFFRVVGLDDELPGNHQYKYFPSMNTGHTGTNEFASDYDLEVYQKKFPRKNSLRKNWVHHLITMFFRK